MKLSRREALIGIAVSFFTAPARAIKLGTPAGVFVPRTVNLPAGYVAGAFCPTTGLAASTTGLPWNNVITRVAPGVYTCSAAPTPLFAGAPYPAPSGVTVIWVSPNGSDLNNGTTPTTPFKSFSKAMALAAGKTQVWLVLDDGVTYWDYLDNYWNGVVVPTNCNFQITTLNGGMVYLTTAFFNNARNSVTWTPVSGRTFSTPIPSNYVIQGVFDNDPNLLITNNTTNGTFHSMGYYAWNNSAYGTDQQVYVSGGLLYITLPAGRSSLTPDGNIFVFLTRVDFSNMHFTPQSTSTTNVFNGYFKKIGFWGSGAINQYALQISNYGGAASQRWTIQVDSCEASYTGGFNCTGGTNTNCTLQATPSAVGGFGAYGFVDCLYKNCFATSNYDDSYFLKGYSTAPIGTQTVINCVGIDGNQGLDTRSDILGAKGTQNSITSHDAGVANIAVGHYGDALTVPFGYGNGGYALDFGSTYLALGPNDGGGVGVQSPNQYYDSAIITGVPGESGTSYGWFYETKTLPLSGTFDYAAPNNIQGETAYIWQPTAGNGIAAGTPAGRYCNVSVCNAANVVPFVPSFD
jgi:hypothetical protein